MRILVLDDMKVRHEAFGRIYSEHEVVSVYTYTEFLRQLEGARFDLIHLDHDLGDAVSNPDTWVDGWGSTREFTGGHAALRVCELSEDMRPHAVVVHSVNTSGAVQMLKDLRRVGIDCKWEPFGEAPR